MLHLEPKLREAVPRQPTVSSGDSPEEIAYDIAVIQRMDVLPDLLEVLCDLTEMRFVVVARVTEGTWTACAVKDTVGFGIPVGGQLPVETTMCLEVKHLNEPVVINDVGQDFTYRDHHTPRIYSFKSYISVPIVLKDGRYFGNLCAIDPEPADIKNPKIIRTFTRFAGMIAVALRNQELQDRDLERLLDEQSRNELREQFIAILGHDLRNPLQAIFASGELLARKPNDPVKVLQSAQRIVASAKRMSMLINDVLDFARGKLGGGIGLSVDDADGVKNSLEHVVNELQIGHPTREILANINVRQQVRCDLARVQQVASNLISNALIHGAPDKPVRVTAHTDNDSLVFEVWNDGEPIPSESVSKIFEPFWRNSTSASRQGLGLGLHICSQIVRAHHGNLSVTSSSTDGTRFTARLPLRELSTP